MAQRSSELKLKRKKMANKVLVTVGAGFMGSYLVDKLIEDGHRVQTKPQKWWQITF